jgi:hypothetical protein
MFIETWFYCQQEIIMKELGKRLSKLARRLGILAPFGASMLVVAVPFSTLLHSVVGSHELGRRKP